MYPFKNVTYKNSIPTSYQEAMTGNVVPSEELVDFDATSASLSARDRINQIDEEIAQLQKIVNSEKTSRQSEIDDMQRDPRFAMSAIEYINRGDTSGFNSIAQSIQSEKQRKSNEAIQNAIKNKSEMEEVDRLVADRKKAISAYNAAVTEAEEYDKTGTRIQRARAKKAIEEALAEVNRINARLGREANDGIVSNANVELAPQQEAGKESSDEKNVNELIAEMSTINKFDRESDKTEAMEKIKSRPEFREDSQTGNKLRAEYERLSNITSSESSKAYKAKVQAEYDSLKTRSERNDWVRANPDKAKLIGVSSSKK